MNNELSELLRYSTESERALLDRLATDPASWFPLPGPQTDAYLSDADELFYGGAAGGGKTDLLIGLATTAHRRSIIFRREYPQLRSIIDRSREIIGERGTFNGSDNIWRLADGRVLEFGAAQNFDAVKKYQGRPHDLKAFDELPNFTESQYRFLIGWTRTTRVGQRTRIVGAGNPPTSAEGEWVIRRWAPWLDGQHPHPAEPGELRWYAVIDGIDTEVEDGASFERKGELITPKSRTFIPARLTDNPYLMAAGYTATLQAMPEPLRSQMLYGDFSAGAEDDPWQVIPTAWVRAAQSRWRPDGRPTITDRHGSTRPAPLTALGVDVARGGRDKTALSRRYGAWFAEVETHPGSSTPDGATVARLILQALTEGGYANIDAIGVGASVYDLCVQQAANVRPVINSAGTSEYDRSHTLTFTNVRAYAYWSLREALDPDKGDGLALPPDPELLADLCAPRWTMRTNGVQVEPKEQIIERIGRSPDKGDAVVLAALITGGLPYQGAGWDDAAADEQDDW